MSFLDQLGKNIDSKANFLNQLNQLSGKQRNSFSVDSADLGASQDLTSKSGFTPKEKAEVQTKDDDKQVKKQDFFKTAKKTFDKYKDKASKKEDKKADTIVKKEANNEVEVNEPEKEEKETDELLAVLFGAAKEASPELQDSNLLETLKLEDGEPNPGVVSFFLESLESQVNTEIENLTKEIANLDLNTEEGISAILELSNAIEELQKLQEGIEGLQAGLPVESGLEEIDSELQARLEKLLATKITTKLDEVKVNANKPETMATDINQESLDKALDEVKASIKQAEALKNNVKDTNTTKATQNPNEFTAKVVKEVDVKTETKVDFKSIKAEGEILEVENVSNEEGSKDFNFRNDNFETLFPKKIKASNIKVKTLAKPVSVNKLPDLISKEAKTLRPNAKQEIRMVLNPENLGKLQLNMSKEDNQIHISLVVRTDEAAAKLEQKVNDIRLALKEQGFEAQIEVNKSDTNNSSESQQNNNQAQDNETSQEQKEKLANQIPEWINQDVEPINFEEALEEVSQ